MRTNIELLIGKSLRGDTTPAEGEALRAWREESPENERAYQDLRALVAEAPALLTEFDPGPAPSATQLLRDVEPAVAAGRRRRLPLPRRVHRGFGPRRAWVMAAVLVLVALGIQRFSRDDQPSGFQSMEFVTSAGETRTIELPDGTVVRLSGNSRLSLVADKGQRITHLEGSAFFAVAHQPDRPFLVRGEGGEVRVLGTRFVLDSSEDRLQLVVIEGRVTLAAPEGEVEVSGGQEVAVVDGIPGQPSDHRGINTAPEWLGNFLAFQSTPLAVAAEEVEMRYGVEVEVADEALRNRVVTAWFDDSPLPEVVEVLCMAVVARCEIEEGVVRIAPE